MIHPCASTSQNSITPIPQSILKEIVHTLGYDTNDKRSGPDGKSDHTIIKGLERTAFLVLGNNVLDWEQTLSNEEKYNNQALGRKVYLCFRPLIDKKMNWLHADAITDALRVYEQNEELSFACYGPYIAGYEFTEALLKRTAKHYAFVFNTSTTISQERLFSGSHYVVVFIDIIRNQVDYYDSKGTMPNEMIKKSICCILKVIKNHNPELCMEVNFTRKRKQLGSNACAIYVVHFVVQRLLGKSFEDFNDEYLPDKQIEKYRKIYWTVVDKPLFDYE